MPARGCSAEHDSPRVSGDPAPPMGGSLARTLEDSHCGIKQRRPYSQRKTAKLLDESTSDVKLGKRGKVVDLPGDIRAGRADGGRLDRPHDQSLHRGGAPRPSPEAGRPRPIRLSHPGRFRGARPPGPGGLTQPRGPTPPRPRTPHRQHGTWEAGRWSTDGTAGPDPGAATAATPWSARGSWPPPPAPGPAPPPASASAAWSPQRPRSTRPASTQGAAGPVRFPDADFQQA